MLRLHCPIIQLNSYIHCNFGKTTTRNKLTIGGKFKFKFKLKIECCINIRQIIKIDAATITPPLLKVHVKKKIFYKANDTEGFLSAVSSLVAVSSLNRKAGLSLSIETVSFLSSNKILKYLSSF